MNTREIKFRAWDNKRNEMVDWEGITGHGSTMFKILCNPDNDYVVMQHTGLCDKGGNPIHEGDIVKRERISQKLVWIVRFYIDGFKLQDTRPVHKESKEAKPYGINYSEWSTLTIIGNIYEHPHLTTSKP